MEKYYEKYHGKKFPVRTVVLSDVKEFYNMGSVNVSVQSLWDEIESDYWNDVLKAIDIDESIMYYFDDDFINSDPTDEEIVKQLIESIS